MPKLHSLLSSLWLSDFRGTASRHASCTTSATNRSGFTGKVLRSALFTYVAVSLTACGGLVPNNTALGELVALSPSVDFGQVSVGSSTTANVSFKNASPVPVTLTNAALSSDSFSVSSSAQLPLTLESGKSGGFSVQFTPKASGTQSAQMTIASNIISGATTVVALAGTGSAQAALSGVACDQTSITGAATSTCTVTLSAAAPSGGFSVALQSSNPSIIVPAKIVVASGKTTATFVAKVLAVNAAAAVTVTAQAGNATKTFAINLLAIVPKLNVNASALFFGSLMAGSNSATQTLTLTSSGSAPVVIQSLQLTGSNYTISSGRLPITLPPGAATTVTVRFTPTTVTAVTGRLTIASNLAPSSAPLIFLVGTVTPFKASLSGFFCGSPTVLGLGSDSCVVVLTGAAGDGGTTIPLSSDNPAITVPSSITVPAGQTKGAFMATRAAAGTSATAHITAGSGSVTRSVALSLVASNPVFSLPAGSYKSAIALSMSDATPGVNIYYTTDGSTPTTSSPRYFAPITVATTSTVQALAASAGAAASTMTTAKYTVAAATTQVAANPAGSTLTVPAVDACQSPYDQFYGAEPGVYAFWPMCEAGSNIDIFDYVGNWSLSENFTSGQVVGWGIGNVAGGLPGPVPDGETAAQAAITAVSRANVGIPLNANQGTIAIWLQSQPSPSLEQAMLFYVNGSKSSIALGTKTPNNGTTCFVATLVDADGTGNAATDCGHTATDWNRVVMTWKAGTISVYVNGEMGNTAPYTGAIDNKVFTYRLFPACCGYNKTMTLAKALVANQAWTPAEVIADFRPNVSQPPSGGVFVTGNQLGTIHRDVLGIADDNSNVTDPAQVALMKNGFTKAGFTAVRYANGSGGITADLENWQGGNACGWSKGTTQTALNSQTGNSITKYMPNVAQPLGLDIGFTANYGTNPPYCDNGGDPNSIAQLVNLTNVVNNYGMKYFEVGNEVWSGNTEPDFHANPHTGLSYIQNEPAFYDAIKSQDPTAQVGIPIAGVNMNTQLNFDLPVLASTKYDAIVFHNYPIKAPIADGTTLYRDRAATNLLKTRGELLTLQTELLNAGKPGDAIWITEWDANPFGNKWTKQSMGAVMPLFAATELGEYMRAGVRYATWWAQSAIDVCSNSNYDTSGDSAYSWWNCGAAGMVYNGPNPGYGHEVLVGMAPGDLMPAAHAFQVLSQSGFVVEGEHMLSTIADGAGTPWLQTYAATHGNSYAVMLINRDRDNAHTVPVEFAGLQSGSAVQQWTYGRAQYDLTKEGNWTVGPAQSSHGAWSGAYNATLPPWSVTVLVFTR